MSTMVTISIEESSKIWDEFDAKMDADKAIVSLIIARISPKDISEFIYQAIQHAKENPTLCIHDIVFDTEACYKKHIEG